MEYTVGRSKDGERVSTSVVNPFFDIRRGPTKKDDWKNDGFGPVRKRRIKSFAGPTQGRNENIEKKKPRLSPAIDKKGEMVGGVHETRSRTSRKKLNQAGRVSARTTLGKNVAWVLI